MARPRYSRFFVRTGLLGLLVGLALSTVSVTAAHGQPRPGAFTTLTASSTVNVVGPLTVTSTAAGSLDIGGGLNAGTGNVALIGADGRLAQLSGTTVSSTTLAGSWTVATNLSIGGASLASNGSIGSPSYSFTNDSNSGLYSNADNVLGFVVAGTERVTLSLNATTINNAPTITAAISPAALPLGSTNDYGPTGLDSTYVLRLTPNAGNSTLTGLVAQTAGSIRVICNVGAAGNLNINPEDAGSAAANRFALTSTGGAPGACLFYWYDGTSARWRRIQ